MSDGMRVAISLTGIVVSSLSAGFTLGSLVRGYFEKRYYERVIDALVNVGKRP